MNEPDYIVLRPGPTLQGMYIDKHYDGYWYDRSEIPVSYDTVETSFWKAHPSGKFEVREDGVVAEVWEVDLV